MALKIRDLTGEFLSRRRERIASAKALAQLRSTAGSGWKTYEGLQPASLILAGITIRAQDPAVNLLMPKLTEGSVFAGQRTALLFGARLARSLGRELRVLHFSSPLSEADNISLTTYLAEMVDVPVSSIRLQSAWLSAWQAFSDRDLWIATFWSTAHALDVACKLEQIDRSQVVYFVQDYEAEFYPGSTESALCRATYHAGFQLVLNSHPLAAYLSSREGLTIDPAMTFRPELDVSGLTRAAKDRVRQPKPRIGFYGRPSKPRNSFTLGVSTIRAAVHLFDEHGIDAHFVSVGEKHAPLRAGSTTMHSLGKLGWSEYFSFLSKVDVMFSLQQTPHPSHLPLDAVASGTFAVTNEHGGTRAGLSPRMLARQADPVDLSRALLEAVERVLAGEQSGVMDRPFIESLGRPLDLVADSIAARSS